MTVRTSNDLLNEGRAIATLQEAVRRPSITGAEGVFVAYLSQRLRGLGFDHLIEREFKPGRSNLIAVKNGRGGGGCLLLIGHTDVVSVNGWAERWRGDSREDPFGAAIADGAIWGRGSADLKAGLAMVVEAMHSILERGGNLAGDIVLAFVGDEESGEPGLGVSAGMKSLMAMLDAGELPRPDMAIYVEPTTLDIYTAQIGFFIAEIEIEGRTAYFGVPEQGVDALKASHAVLAALWEHSEDLERRGAHDLVGCSFLLVTTIEGGGLIAVPGRCKLNLIRKLRPGEDLDEARRELEAAASRPLQGTEIRMTFHYPAGRDHPLGGQPCEIDPAHRAVALLGNIVRERRPERGRIKGAPFWSEASFLIARGVPTVYFAPGDISICHTAEERVPVSDYLAGICCMTEFIEQFCGWKPAIETKRSDP